MQVVHLFSMLVREKNTGSNTLNFQSNKFIPLMRNLLQIHKIGSDMDCDIFHLNAEWETKKHEWNYYGIRL